MFPRAVSLLLRWCYHLTHSVKMPFPGGTAKHFEGWDECTALSSSLGLNISVISLIRRILRYTSNSEIYEVVQDHRFFVKHTLSIPSPPSLLLYLPD